MAIRSGRWPDEQPYMYDQRQGHEGELLVGRVGRSSHRDLPRNTQGRALIGDMRNDENSIVSQLQLAFLLAHNRLVERARAAGAQRPFERAQQTLRWLYQWVVWHDWVRRITEPDVFAQGLRPERGFRDVYSWRNQPFMPVEFAVAVYRFGHSMVRNGYQTNIEGLLAGDPQSWVNRRPDRTPDDDSLLRPGTDNVDDAGWKLSSIIRLSGLPVNAGEF